MAVASQKTMKPMRYVYPLDPECPVVAEFMETLFGDPTTMAIGAPVIGYLGAQQLRCF